MKAEITTVVDFLKTNGMHHEDIDFNAAVAAFRKEMDRGLAGNGGSLAMIPTYIEIPGEIPADRPVIVLDAGGTNFRVAVVAFDERQHPVISEQQCFRMPGTERETSRRDFFGAIAAYMEKVRDASDRIGFCFSYPTEIQPSKDGKVLHFSKEIKAREVLGGLVGEGLLVALKERGLKGRKRVILLNDTVTTLLAGTASLQERRYSGFLGFILGTGTNIAYMEKNPLITKLPALPAAGGQIINVETGDFSLAPTGVLDRRMDQGTKDPGRYTYEKMISGAYFGPLCGVVVNAAGAGGLFSPAAAEKLTVSAAALETRTVSDFLHAPFGRNPLAGAVTEERDRVTLYALLDRLVERSALLAAVGLAAVVLKQDGGEDPSRPVCVSAEGSTFFGLRGLRFRTEYYLKKYLTDERRRHVEFVSIDNATLVGAAVAGLTN